MRLIRSKQYRRQPWKNGGGETIEIAVSPAGAGIDDFDWRVSMARVEADGPFSAFANIDRTLTMLEGEGIELTLEGQAPVRIESEPHAFPGDVETHAKLLDGPIADLNVMTRRGRLTHRVRPISTSGIVDFVVRSPTALLYCHSGAVSVGDEYADPFELAAGDSLLIEAQPNSLRLVASAHSVLFLVEIGPA
ncbi:MAG: HutD family protein [Rhizobiaceae bacterium]